MESKLFKNVSVVKTNPIMGQRTPNVCDMDHVHFFQTLGTRHRPDIIKDLNFHLAHIKPNEIGKYLFEVADYLTDNQIETLLLFLSDENLAKLKEVAHHYKYSPTRLHRINQELAFRQSKEYVKYLFFKSCQSSCNPLDNMVIYELYHSLYLTGVCEVNFCDKLIQLRESLSSLLPDESKCCTSHLDIIIGCIVRHFELHERYVVTDETSKASLNEFCYFFEHLLTIIHSGDSTPFKMAYNYALYLKQGNRTENSLKFIDWMITLLENTASVKSLLENTGVEDIEDFEDEIEADVSDTLIDMMFEEDEIVLEKMDRLIQLSYLYESKAADKIVKGLNVGKRGSQKTVKGIRTVATDAKKIKRAAGEIPKPFIDLVNGSYNKIKSMDAERRRNEIIRDKSLTTKLRKCFKLGIKIALATNAFTILGPALGALTCLVGFYVDGYLNQKERRKLVEELEFELKIVREKLDDSKSDGNKKAKYELMRLEKELEKNLKKIKRLG